MTVLVTGGTGRLGRDLVPRLDDVRVLSRRAGPGRVVGDLATGVGLDDALAGVTVVVHCATRARHDSHDAARLVEGARRAGVAHLLYVSIVGADRIPLGYYREKVAGERVVASSGLGWTIQRATQFHQLLDGIFTIGARSGVLPVLADTPFQPIGTGAVAARLAELAVGPPRGRAPDLGGPAVRSMADLGRAWLASRGARRRVVPLRLPGAIARGYRSGAHTTPAHAEGTVTFEQYLAAR